MQNEKIEILIIDDKGQDSKKLTKLFLESGSYSFRITQENSLQKAVSLVKNRNFDAAFLSITPAGFNQTAIDQLLSVNPGLPIVALIEPNKETANLTLELGAKDYLYKDNLNTEQLERTVRYLNECVKTHDLAVSESHDLQTIRDSVNIGMLYFDKNGLVKQANRTAKRWFGKAIRDININRLGDLFNCIYAKDEGSCADAVNCRKCSIKNIGKKVMDSKKTIYGAEVESSILVDLKPAKIRFEVNAEPMIIKGNRNVILTINDITKRKEAEAILKRDKETFEKLVKEKSRDLFITQIELDRAKRLSDLGLLSATVAHELRNPLAAIEMASYNLKRKISDPSIASHIKTIENKVGESEKIISNLLYYSRIKPPKLEKVRLDEIVIECINLAKKRFMKANLEVTYDLKQIENLEIDIDPHQMREVFENVINNAFEAGKGKEGKIEILGRVDGNYMEFTVKDNGEGIEEEILEMIFSPFFTTKAKGTGLGLTVCKQIIQLHGGTIEITSKKHKGTAVTIKLPFNYGK